MNRRALIAWLIALVGIPALAGVATACDDTTTYGTGLPTVANCAPKGVREVRRVEQSEEGQNRVLIVCVDGRVYERTGP